MRSAHTHPAELALRCLEGGPASEGTDQGEAGLTRDIVATLIGNPALPHLAQGLDCVIVSCSRSLWRAMDQ